MRDRYQMLFLPFKIGKVEVRNRIVKTAAQTYFFDSGEQRVGGIARAFYGAVARDGVGLVITETPRWQKTYPKLCEWVVSVPMQN